MNVLTNIRRGAAAVSDRDGELPLFVGPPNYKSGDTTTVASSRRTLGRRLGLREQGRVRGRRRSVHSKPPEELVILARLIKVDVEGGEDRVLAGMLASVDALAADAELVVEVMPKWWSDPQLRPIDVLRPLP